MLSYHRRDHLYRLYRAWLIVGSKRSTETMIAHSLTFIIQLLPAVVPTNLIDFMFGGLGTKLYPTIL